MEWRDWLPEAGIGTGALALLLRFFGRSSPGRLARFRDALFEAGSLYIRYKRSESDNQAKDETIAALNRQKAEKDAIITSQNSEIEVWKARAYSLGYPNGSTKNDTAPLPTQQNGRPPTPK